MRKTSAAPLEQPQSLSDTLWHGTWQGRCRCHDSTLQVRPINQNPTGVKGSPASWEHVFAYM